MKKAIIMGAVCAACFTTAAHGQEERSRAGDTFIEIGGGAGAVEAGSFDFINPDGAGYISTFPIAVPGVSQTRGKNILLDRQRRHGTSPTAEATVGHFVGDSVYLRATYRYLGRYHLSGSAGFPLDPTVPVTIAFDQDYYLRGHAAYVGVGYQKTLAGALFVDLSVEGGAAKLHSVSRQGANVGDPFGHPARTVTNLAGGGEIGLGVHISRKLDLLFKGHVDYLGSASTGVTAKQMVTPDGNYGINAGEQLKLRHLQNYGLAMTLRASF